MEPITLTGARPIRVPEALFVLIGPPGSGKSRLAASMVANGLDPEAVVSWGRERPDKHTRSLCARQPHARHPTPFGCSGAV